MVYVSVWPAITGSGVSVLVTLISACAFTVVVWEAVLLVVSESASAALTVTVLVIVPRVAESTHPDRVMVTDPPAGTVPRLQTTVPATPSTVHVPCVLDAVGTYPDGRVSVTSTLVASVVPMFCTTMVYVNVCPAITGSGVSVLVMLKSTVTSGAGPTGTASVAGSHARAIVESISQNMRMKTIIASTCRRTR